jgi:hypothetical protein
LVNLLTGIAHLKGLTFLEPLTEKEKTDNTLDLFDKPLTATGHRNFDHDKAAHAELTRNYNTETERVAYYRYVCINN